MKILLVLCRPLFPTDTGGRIRTLNTFSRVASCAEVCAVSLAVTDRDGDAIVKMKQVFQDYVPVFWKESKTLAPAWNLSNGRPWLSPFGSLYPLESANWLNFNPEQHHQINPQHTHEMPIPHGADEGVPPQS